MEMGNEHRTHHIIDAAHLAVVPDGTIITWLRIPGDHTSEAVAFVRREVDYNDSPVNPTVTTWISPGGWDPQTIESAGVNFPCRVVRWGELASQVVLGGELPALTETLDSGGTWARQAALDYASRFWAGQSVNSQAWVDHQKVIDTAVAFLNWLTTTDAEEYERGYADGESSSSFDWKHHLGLARDDAETQFDADLRNLVPEYAERGLHVAAIALAMTNRGWVKITEEDNG